MSCNRRNSQEKFFSEQEHREMNRLWKRAIEKLSAPRANLPGGLAADGGGRNVRFGTCENVRKNEAPKRELPSEAVQKKLLKAKGIPKMRSPLQKFDEVVTRELTTLRLSGEGGGLPSFAGSKNWSNMQFGGMTEFTCTKITAESKVSRGALFGVEKEVRESDPSDIRNAALMEAIEKLAQAQAFCRFDAAVKAAEAATASVPPDMAEEVAVACTKDYQSEIVDFINEKIPLSEERKPIEVIGYIGVTKLKENL